MENLSADSYEMEYVIGEFAYKIVADQGTHEKLATDRFRNKAIKKKNLWVEIENEFSEHGYKISQDSLDRKFRNLKKTYTKIKDNKSSTGAGNITWEWFPMFEEIFSEDRAVNLPKTVSSIPFETLATLSSTPALTKKDDKTIDDLLTPSTSQGLSRRQTTKFSKKKTLMAHRENVLKLEKEKLAQIALLHEEIKRSNDIQERRNDILARILDKMDIKQ